MKKLITSLYFLIIGLFVENEEKARLDRIDDTPLLNKLGRKIEDFILAHASFFLLLILIILFVLLTALLYAIIGVSAVDSGTYYNHFQEVI